MSIVEMPFNVNESVLDLVKLGVIFALLLYLAFSILVIRQAQLMTRTVTGKLDKTIRSVAWGYFTLTVVVFLLSLFFL
jgi:hypothetical protein